MYNNKNYFALLDIPVSLSVDLLVLEKKYLLLIQKKHLSSFNDEIFSDLNAAYQTLSDPLLRARYLLKLLNVDDEKVIIDNQKFFLDKCFFYEEKLEQDLPVNQLRSYHIALCDEINQIEKKVLFYFNKRKKNIDTICHEISLFIFYQKYLKSFKNKMIFLEKEVKK